MEKEEKKLDCVKMVREIRDKLHEKYKNDPEARKKDLEKIRKKYGLESKTS